MRLGLVLMIQLSGDAERRPFQLTSIEYAGSYDGEAVFEMSLASAGALTFTAV